MEMILMALLWWVIAKAAGAKKKKKKQAESDWRAQVAKMLAQEENDAKKRAARVSRTQTEQPKPVILNAHHEPLAEGESHQTLTSFSEGAQYVGSLHTTSTEGFDTCDPTLLHDAPVIEPESVYANQIGAEPVLDFSPRGLYQGVVMSEILTRPGLRRNVHG